MISITILGTGNVAQNLFEAFLASDTVTMIQVVGRNIEKLNYFKTRASLGTYDDELKPADIYILAISDDAIQEISHSLKLNGLLVHTSGAMPLSILSTHTRIGAFYPLQTFTAGKIMDFSMIPICIEANNEKDTQLLNELANAISSTVKRIDSQKRKALHLSAVFVNNFSNFMYTIGEQICSENAIDFSLLTPLIEETAHKIKSIPPYKAQTGPARRGDQKTLHTHLALLKNKNQREIYTLLSNSLKVMYTGQNPNPKNQ